MVIIRSLTKLGASTSSLIDKRERLMRCGRVISVAMEGWVHSLVNI